MSQYTGKCIAYSAMGEVKEITVVDAVGTEVIFTAEEYEMHGVQPPHNQLPNCEDVAGGGLFDE